MEGNDTTRKLAFCGAIIAGIAYFGFTIVKDAFGSNRIRRDKTRRRNSDTTDAKSINKCVSIESSRLSHASSQTDLTLPIGTSERMTAFRTIPPELWSPWAKSIHERIRELNIRMINTTNISLHTPLNKLHQLPSSSLSLQNSPRHSPYIRTPDSGQISSKSFHSLSRSAEDLNHVPPLSPKLLSTRSNVGLARVLCVPSDTEIAIHKRTLESLYGKSNSNISQHEASSFTVLLLSRDDDILVKTLSVIANCAAFTANIDPICDCGCILLLSDLLDHNCVAVRVAATHAVANVATGERAQELLKECIPILIDHLKTCTNELQLNWTLIALANLALKEVNQLQMTCAINKMFNLITHSSPVIRLQSVKLLVNLSSNSEIVPYLLASKAPINLLSLLNSATDGEFLLRWCHFLANVITITCMKDIRAQNLPPEYKAPSPETLYAAIYGFESSELFILKLNNLMENLTDDETLFHVKRILKKVR